jgi:hypothetical protein
MSGERDRQEARKTRKRKGRTASGLLGGLVGMGLDDDGGHRRITRGDDFVLFGGSRETHERMTDIVLRMRERLKKSGRSFEQLSPREFEDLGRDCV